MTLSQFIQAGFDYSRQFEQMRLGQAYFNKLDEVRPDLTAQITGTDLDPFYQDCRLQAFFNWLGEHWENKNEDKNNA